jgi:hypothetical protein
METDYVEISTQCTECGKRFKVSLRSASDSGELRCSSCGKALFSVFIPAGFIYVLSNPKMLGLVKIGCTTRAVEARVEELNAATGVPSPFIIEAIFPSMSPFEDESKAHEWLKERRIAGREFFEISVEETIRAIQAIIGTQAKFMRIPCSGIVELKDINRWSCGLCKNIWDAPLDSVFDNCPECAATSVVKLGHAIGPIPKYR